MAQRDAYPRKQLRSPEGFCEVIIGTGIEGGDLLRFLVACG